MFGTKKNLNKESTIYAGIALHLSAKTADDLRKEVGYTEEDSTVIMLQVLTFCILNLMRTFAQQGVSVEKGREAIELILHEAAKTFAPDPTKVQDTYLTLNQTVNDWIQTYGKLPLGEKFGTEAGTLIWEYSKLMALTANKDKDVSVMMTFASRIVNVNNALETSNLVKALK
jgi:hypothetical protein